MPICTHFLSLPCFSLKVGTHVLVWLSFPLLPREPALLDFSVWEIKLATFSLHLLPSPVKLTLCCGTVISGVWCHTMTRQSSKKTQCTWPSSSFLQIQRVASAAEQGGAFTETCKRLESHGGGWSCVALLLQKNKEDGGGRTGYSRSSFSYWLLCLKMRYFLGKPRNGECLLWIFSRIHTRSFWTPRCTVNKCKL